MSVDTNRTVRELAVEVPGATRVFEKLGIDYCCGGGKSLQEACVQAKVPAEEVARALEQGRVAETGSREMASPEKARLKEVIDHIVNTHHVYVKGEIPRLQQLLAKVVTVHGANHPELAEVQMAFAGLAAELQSHMMKEEMVLFPYVAELEDAAGKGKSAPHAPFGTVRNPVHMMETEHESAGDALRRMRTASRGYAPPEDACFSYKALYSALQDFETDLHQHIHLENNILFPQAVALEEKAA